MNDITKSFFHLAKKNNGFFKSEAQAKFLLKHVDADGEFVGMGDSVYGNSVMFTFHVDETGVVKIEKQTKNKDEVYWERCSDEEFQAIKARNEKRRDMVAWANKAGRMVMERKRTSTDRLIKLMADKPTGSAEMIKVIELFSKWESKMKRIEKMCDDIHSELERG